MEVNVKELFSLYSDLTKMCAAEVVKRCEADKRGEVLKKLDAAMSEVSNVEHLVEKETECIRIIEDEMNKTSENQPDLITMENLSQMLDEKLGQKASKGAPKIKSLSDYRSHVEKLISNLELDDMIVMSSEATIDPYSKKEIEHPVRTKFCNHVFEKTSVMEVLATKGKNGKLRCPYIGCQQWFTAKDLIDNESMDGDDDE